MNQVRRKQDLGLDLTYKELKFEAASFYAFENFLIGSYL